MKPGDFTEVLVALVRLDLITEEQAEEELANYEEEWERARADAEWWWALADVAYDQYARGWTRFWGLAAAWKYKWINERRWA